ncbi:hypothetical protein D3C73_801950 [compost metagenome]
MKLGNGLILLVLPCHNPAITIMNISLDTVIIDYGKNRFCMFQVKARFLKKAIVITIHCCDAI